MYRRFVKRILDIVLSVLGMLLLSWLYLVISAAILMDDPGPVIFSQKRIGQHKKTFMLHKFRSMRRSTPHDVPTHLMQDPQRYITKVGRFIRKSSLDELPQIWDIFVGRMSVVGPRPALWNQEDLIAERDRYGVNELRPGLTGWAQINGRDELEIPEKARLDGEYADALRKGGWKAFTMDLKCFFGTFLPVATGKGVVEGAELTDHKEQKENELVE